MKSSLSNVGRRRSTPAKCADVVARPATLLSSLVSIKNPAARVLEVSARVLAGDPGSRTLRYVYSRTEGTL